MLIDLAPHFNYLVRVMHERDLVDYEANIANQIREEVKDNDPVLQRCRLVSFVSRSAGRGRKRKPREVNFLVIDNRYAFQVVRGEVKSRKINDFMEPDMVALEVLQDISYEERSTEILLKRAMKRI